MEITKQMQEIILKEVWVDPRDGSKRLSLGNCRLDFSKNYLFLGFTNKGVKLAERNGRDDIINYVAKAKPTETGFKLYTEGFSFIEKFENKKEVDTNEKNI